jgi:hypothetical protein
LDLQFQKKSTSQRSLQKLFSVRRGQLSTHRLQFVLVSSQLSSQALATIQSIVSNNPVHRYQQSTLTLMLTFDVSNNALHLYQNTVIQSLSTIRLPNVINNPVQRYQQSSPSLSTNLLSIVINKPSINRYQ